MLTAVLLLNDKKRFISHGNDVVHAYLHTSVAFRLDSYRLRLTGSYRCRLTGRLQIPTDSSFDPLPAAAIFFLSYVGKERAPQLLRGDDSVRPIGPTRRLGSWGTRVNAPSVAVCREVTFGLIETREYPE